jgi:hypothetical protein
MPYDLRNAIPHGLNDEDPQDPRWEATVELTPHCWESVIVTAEEHRIIEEYESASERRQEAEIEVEKRWNPPRHAETEPEELPPDGKLTARQEEFCRHYAAQPVATHAAALAGYAEEFAKNQGYRLLKNPLVLDRVAQLRAERGVRYTLERDTMHDKLEALFFDALNARNHAAAVAALRLQARLGGILAHSSDAAADDDRDRRQRRPRRSKKTTGDDQ